MPKQPNAELAVELAWGLIANAHGGDWELATKEWKTAAERWRDDFVGVTLAESDDCPEVER